MLNTYLLIYGNPSEIPYINYLRAKRKYVITEKSTYYNECVIYKISYNGINFTLTYIYFFPLLITWFFNLRIVIKSFKGLKELSRKKDEF